MKKKEKLKDEVARRKTTNTQTNNQILLSDLELGQVSGPPKSGFLPGGTGRISDTTNFGGATGADWCIVTENSAWIGKPWWSDGTFDVSDNCWTRLPD